MAPYNTDVWSCIYDRWRCIGTSQIHSEICETGKSESTRVDALQTTVHKDCFQGHWHLQLAGEAKQSIVTISEALGKILCGQRK